MWTRHLHSIIHHSPGKLVLSHSGSSARFLASAKKSIRFWFWARVRRPPALRLNRSHIQCPCWQITQEYCHNNRGYEAAHSPTIILCGTRIAVTKFRKSSSQAPAVIHAPRMHASVAQMHRCTNVGKSTVHLSLIGTYQCYQCCRFHKVTQR